LHYIKSVVENQGGVIGDAGAALDTAEQEVEKLQATQKARD
jgi:hypothetical protein